MSSQSELDDIDDIVTQALDTDFDGNYFVSRTKIRPLIESYCNKRIISELKYMRDNFVTPDKGGVKSWAEIRIKELEK